MSSRKHITAGSRVRQSEKVFTHTMQHKLDECEAPLTTQRVCDELRLMGVTDSCGCVCVNQVSTDMPSELRWREEDCVCQQQVAEPWSKIRNRSAVRTSNIGPRLFCSPKELWHTSVVYVQPRAGASVSRRLLTGSKTTILMHLWFKGLTEVPLYRHQARWSPGLLRHIVCKASCWFQTSLAFSCGGSEMIDSWPL